MKTLYTNRLASTKNIKSMPFPVEQLPEDAEIKRLKRKVADLEEENAIPKRLNLDQLR